MMKRLLALLWLASASFLVQAQTPAWVRQDLDRYIREGMERWQVPGLAIVIVKDGQVVLRKGYGVSDITSRTPVDTMTHFFIASNTKLFTGTALAMLQHSGKLNLNDRVTQYFPDFRLADSLATRQVTLRDMLTHRIGTKTFQGDFTFWNTTLTGQQIMERMRLLQPTGIFRQDYGYCNSCYLVAGQAVGKATATSWHQFIEESILKPAGMHHTLVLSNDFPQRSTNRATPYTTSFTGTLQPVPYDRWDNLAPAASMVSNVTDLTQWLLLQLDSGRVQGRQVIPWPVLQATRDVQIVTGSRRSTQLPINFRGYGLGVNAADYAGRQVYWHTGGAAGMVSNVCFVPSEKLGIAILTNNDNQNFFELLRYQVLDAYLGQPYFNRSEAAWKDFVAGQKQQLDSITAWQSRAGKIKPPLAANAYVGEYVNQLYGKVTLRATGTDRLEVSFEHHPNLRGALTYLEGNEWLIRYNNIEYGIFKATIKTVNGRVESILLPFNDFVEYDPYLFTKTMP